MIKTTLTISGMMCGMCEAHVNDAIRSSFPVKRVSSSRSKGETVILSEMPLDREKVKNCIGNTGYVLLSVKEEDAEKKGLFSGLFRR